MCLGKNKAVHSNLSNSFFYVDWKALQFYGIVEFVSNTNPSTFIKSAFQPPSTTFFFTEEQPYLFFLISFTFISAEEL
jgi:hypothetical protein